MGRAIHIVWAGRRAHEGWQDLCATYQKRIRHHLEISDRPVKTRATTRGSRARLEAEAEALRAALPERAWVVALDRRARQLDSIDFSAHLENLLRSRPHGIVYLIGSDLGLAPTLLAGADERLSLGPMTLPHQLARLVLYEQIYRALSIMAGMKYHREPLG